MTASQRMAIRHLLLPLVLLAFSSSFANVGGMGSDKFLALGSDCTIGSLIDKPCTPGLICLLSKVGQPAVDNPHVGVCNFPDVARCDRPDNTSWAPGAVIPKDLCNKCTCPKMGGRFICTSIPLAECFVDPCRFAKCPAYPTATCRSNYCGVRVNGTCTVGSLIEKNCAPGLVCVLTKQGKPEIDVPNVGTCKPATAPKCKDLVTKTFWAPGTILKKPNCIECYCPRSGNLTFDCHRGPVCDLFIDPCQGTTCSGYPTAKCRLDACSQCHAEWYIGNQIVQCRPPTIATAAVAKVTPIPANGKCLEGTRGARPCATGLRCLLTKQGKPQVDIPNEGTCQPLTAPNCVDPTPGGSVWAPGATFQRDACFSCKCPASGGQIDCKNITAICDDPDPCFQKTCPAFPNAECIPKYCGGCGYTFYVNSKPVNCAPPPPITIPENGTCFVGSRGAKPCAPGLVCWLTRGGQPWIDAPNTGVCKNPKKVKSCFEKSTGYTWAPRSVHDTLPCSSCSCPATGGRLSCVKVLSECFVDPCKTSQCPAHPNAQCRPNYCGGCNADYYVNGKKVAC